MSKKNQNRLLCATFAECCNPDLRRATPSGTGVIGGTASVMSKVSATTTGFNKRAPRVAKMSCRRHNSDASQPTYHQYHQRPGCGSTVAVILVGLAVQTQSGAGQDGLTAIRHFLRKGA